MTEDTLTAALVFVIREALNELYVAPSATHAVAHVRKHCSSATTPADPNEFSYYTAAGQQLSAQLENGNVVGLFNQERFALEDRVWEIVRTQHDDLIAARPDSGHKELIDAMLGETIDIDELGARLAALSTQSGPGHVHALSDHANGGGNMPPHDGSPLHNLCHAVHLCK